MFVVMQAVNQNGWNRRGGRLRARFAARFGCELASVYADAIARMRARGFLEEDAQGVRLTPLGMKYGNWVFEAFLLDA